MPATSNLLFDSFSAMTYILHSDGSIHDADSASRLVAPVQLDAALINVPHLVPHVIAVPMPDERLLHVRVAYSCHCFTEGLESLADAGDRIVIQDGARNRVYCEERYRLSFDLPGMLAKLPGSKVYMTPPTSRREQNYSTFDVDIALEDGRAYRAFFRLKKKRGSENGVPYSVEMFIESAYPTTKIAEGMKVKFLSLVGSVVKGKPIKYNPQ